MDIFRFKSDETNKKQKETIPSSYHMAFKEDLDLCLPKNALQLDYIGTHFDARNV